MTAVAAHLSEQLFGTPQHGPGRLYAECIECSLIIPREILGRPADIFPGNTARVETVVFCDFVVSQISFGRENTGGKGAVGLRGEYLSQVIIPQCFSEPSAEVGSVYDTVGTQ